MQGPGSWTEKGKSIFNLIGELRPARGNSSTKLQYKLGDYRGSLYARAGPLGLGVFMCALIGWNFYVCADWLGLFDARNP